MNTDKENGSCGLFWPQLGSKQSGRNGTSKQGFQNADSCFSGPVPVGLFLQGLITVSLDDFVMM